MNVKPSNKDLLIYPMKLRTKNWVTDSYNGEVVVTFFLLGRWY